MSLSVFLKGVVLSIALVVLTIAVLGMASDPSDPSDCPDHFTIAECVRVEELLDARGCYDSPDADLDLDCVRSVHAEVAGGVR